MRALIRFSGELSTKSKRTRRRFQQKLARNLRDALRDEGISAVVTAEWSRFFVQPADGAPADEAFFERLPAVLGRVFGISTYSLLRGECAADLDEIIATGSRLFADEIRGRTYAVRAHRSGVTGFTSEDVMRGVGAALNEGAVVDLTDPEITVAVDIAAGRAHFYNDRITGPGGLPVGVQGRALALMSGGFDSPVAAWMALGRGVGLDYVFFNLGGAAYARMVLEVTKVLCDRWSYGDSPRFWLVPFGPVADAIRERARPAYLQVVLKRMMYRAAERIAGRAPERRMPAGLVTGESIGQVSSQTLANLRAIDGAAELPVLRPLAGFHKEEIIARARRIGTAKLSARVREYCQLTDSKPVTAATPDAAAAQEERVGWQELETAVAAARVINLRRISNAEMIGGSLYVTDVPAGAEVLDTRGDDDFKAWHWPGARRMNAGDLETGFGRLGRETTYVLCCEQGIRTAYVAEIMQTAGYEAYSFLGGAPGMRRYEAALDRAGEGAEAGANGQAGGIS